MLFDEENLMGAQQTTDNSGRSETKTRFSHGLRIKKIMIIIFSAVVGFCLLYVGYLYTTQRKMIYHPQRYDEAFLTQLPASVAPLAFKTTEGRQICYYVPPAENVDSAPAVLWVMFNGNAVCALDWLDFINNFPDPAAGFLLIEYPGYGQSEGKPSQRGILESSEAAFATLAEHLRVDTKTLERNLNTFGYSLGTGASLQFAALHTVKKVVLIAPFSSMLDMARLTVGSPLNRLLIDRYDNRARLAELASGTNRPNVAIFHGDADQIVPFEMGKELAQLYPQLAVLYTCPGLDHGNILDEKRADVISLMTGSAQEK